MTNAPKQLKIRIATLVRHPLNANVMSPDHLDKLTKHITVSGNYPPLIVRPHPTHRGRFQILDGHNRKTALQRLNQEHAWCQVWDVTDAQALILLSTLNRLEGKDDPYLRGQLLRELAHNFDIAQLAEQLPIDAAEIRKYIQAADTPPKPNAPEPESGQVHALTIFVTAEDRAKIITGLAEFAKDRGLAILTILSMARATRTMIGDTPPPKPPGPASTPAAETASTPASCGSD